MKICELFELCYQAFTSEIYTNLLMAQLKSKCEPLIPPLNPRQLAKMMRGSSSLLKSLIACAVLYAELGNHTWPACCVIFVSVSKLAGSAGSSHSTDLVTRVYFRKVRKVMTN